MKAYKHNPINEIHERAERIGLELDWMYDCLIAISTSQWSRYKKITRLYNNAFKELTGTYQFTPKGIKHLTEFKARTDKFKHKEDNTIYQICHNIIEMTDWIIDNNKYTRGGKPIGGIKMEFKYNEILDVLEQIVEYFADHIQELEDGFDVEMTMIQLARNCERELGKAGEHDNQNIIARSLIEDATMDLQKDTNFSLTRVTASALDCMRFIQSTMKSSKRLSKQLPKAIETEGE